MKRIIFYVLAAAIIGAGPAIAGDAKGNAQAGSAETCRLPSATSATLFECPGLSLYFGAMSIQRNMTDGIIATPPTGTPGTLITGDQFTFSRSSSPDLAVRYRFGGGWSLEGRYFNSHPSGATSDVASVTTFRIAGIGVTILGGGGLNSTYTSRMESFEVNAAKELFPGVTLFGGYRRFNLNDNLQVLLNGTGLNISTWNESNSLNGAQLGVNFGFAMPTIPLHFNAAFKGGVYSNSASNYFTSQVVSSAASAERKQTLAAEADLTATYYVTSRLSLSANYMALWLNNLALAPDAAQLTTQGGGGTASPIAYGTVLYNAVSVRLGYDF